MSDSIINGVFTLLGVALGFGLSYVTTWWQGRRQAEAIRTLLVIEINHNLGLLQTYWTKVEHASQAIGAKQYNFDQDSYGDFETFVLNMSIKRTRVDQPLLNNDYLHSQLSALPAVLSRKELSAIHTFYTSLYNIKNSFIKHEIAQVIRYEVNATKDIQKFVEQILQKGNPLTRR